MLRLLRSSQSYNFAALLATQMDIAFFIVLAGNFSFDCLGLVLCSWGIYVTT